MNILLVSNMYPSLQYPYYGIFVKNCQVMLLNVGFSIDHCVIQKTSSLGEKIRAYSSFFASTFFCYHFNKYHVVYIHYISHSFAPLVFSFFHKRNKILLHIHGGDILKQKEVSSFFFTIKLLIARLAMMRADGIIVPSNYYKKLLIERFHVSPDLINVVASGGVDRSIFHPNFSNESKVFTIGYIGRLDHGKGVETLIKSIAILSKTINAMQCIIVGDGALKKELEFFVRSLGLKDVIAFLGAKTQTTLPQIISKFDIFVFPTERDSESLGLVGLEAMACGVPVIGSKIGGLQDYIINDQNGYFFEPGNSDDLSRKIFMFSQLSKIDKNRLSQGALNTAKRYDSITENEKLLKIIKDLSHET